MDINFSKLGIFGTFATQKGSDGCGILQLKGDAKVSAKYRSWNLLGRWGRSEQTKAANNATRTQLLEALAGAFNYQLERNEKGKVVFTSEFMGEMEKRLGKDVFARSNFGIDKHGLVTSGSPLTERRITAIVDKLRDLKGVTKAERGLRGIASHFMTAVNTAGLEISEKASDGHLIQRALSAVDMAKITKAFKDQHGTAESINTLGKLKELIETATGLTCVYKGMKPGAPEASFANATVPPKYNLDGLLGRAAKHAEIVLDEGVATKRTSMDESVAAENLKKRQLLMTAISNEVKETPAYQNAPNKDKADRKLARLLDPKRPLPQTLSANVIKQAALNMLTCNAKPFEVRIMLEVYDTVVKKGLKMPKKGSPGQRLSNLAHQIVQKAMPVIKARMDEIVNYIKRQMTSKSKSEAQDPKLSDFILDGGSADEMITGDNVVNMTSLLFPLILVEDPEVADAINAATKDDMDYFAAHADDLASQQVKLINVRDNAKGQKKQALSKKFDMVIVEKYVLGEIDMTVAKKLGVELI